jgi:HAD superfamily hydrolase (TIGR01509 family)
MHRIKAVLFDMDGVLVDSEEANFRWISSVIEEYGGYPKPKREDYVPAFGSGRHNVIKSLTKEGSEEKIDKMVAYADTKREGYPTDLLKVTDGVVEVLKKLKGDYKLGVVTSAHRYSLERVFSIIDIKKYFDVIVAREDYTHVKPSPEPLRVAAIRLEINPKDIVYVGDRDVDVTSAHAAGMKVVGFSKERIDGADANVSTFEEIPLMIEGFDS